MALAVRALILVRDLLSRPYPVIPGTCILATFYYTRYYRVDAMKGLPRHREATIRAVGNQTTRPLTSRARSVRPRCCSSWVACGGQAGGGGRVGRPAALAKPR